MLWRPVGELLHRFGRGPDADRSLPHHRCLADAERDAASAHPAKLAGDRWHGAVEPAYGPQSQSRTSECDDGTRPRALFGSAYDERLATVPARRKSTRLSSSHPSIS